ncbi:MAG: hypothetical protein JWO36_2294 [Myxococcales bacterium]|nr:hypothetical protein [Myxococcales bacterium]
MSMLYLGIGLLVAGSLIVVMGLVTRNKAKRILAAPLRRTGEAAQSPNLEGLVGIEGAVRTMQPLMAPCSNRPCVYYSLKIEKKVKEKKGTQTTTSWKTASDQHFGSVFQLDDGSGPVFVQAQEALDADLVQSYSGQPPGGPGLGLLANLVGAVMGGPEVLEYRATERIIPADAKLFALGKLQGGQLGKPQSGKLMVSTRGRDALLGSTKRLATILFAFGGAVAVAGVPVMILKPGEAKPCGESLEGTQRECVVTSAVTDYQELQPDGTTKPGKTHQHVFKWNVTKAGKYELGAKPLPREKKTAYPRIGVENSLGFPMNVGINIGITKASEDYKTKTTTLKPGAYTVTVWSLADGPDKLILSIKELAGNEVTSK